MFKRLKSVSGEVELAEVVGQDTPDRIVRRAVLVHAGPDGAEVSFDSSDGAIKFSDERIQAVIDAQNALTEEHAEHYGGLAKMPVGAHVPILDQHEADSMNRVRGRLTGKLVFERRAVPKVGENVACAVAEITFLGTDTVERVKDGRIFALSVGIDEETNTLSEVSTVIDPAAPGAMILKKGMKHQPKRKLKGATMEQKKLKADRLKKLEAAQKSLKQMSSKLVAAKEKIDLAAAKANVTKRLSAVVRGGKMTPAEFKKLDVKRLAALSKDALDVVVDAYEAREPQVLVGQRGSASAMDFSSIGESLEKRQQKRLRAEIRGDLKKMGAKLKDDADDMPAKKRMSDEEKIEKRLELDETAAAVETVPQVDQTQGLGEMQGQIDEINTQLSRIAGLVSDLVDESQDEEETEDDTKLDDEAKDDAEMAKDDEDKKDDAEMSAVDDENKKELAEDGEDETKATTK